MRTAMRALVACAELDPLPHTLSFVIAPDGTVSDVAGMTGCFAEAIKTAHFAAALALPARAVVSTAKCAKRWWS